MSQIVSIETCIKGLFVIERRPRSDERGFFERLFCQETLNELLNNKNIRQINHTFTHKKGAVRGLHFQYPPNAETKLVTCIKGKVWDVAVDLRKGSPTFLQYFGVILSADNFQSLLIPEGFAHGFQTITKDCEMLYFHTADYQSETEGSINATDPHLEILWPLPIAERSFRDTNQPFINKEFTGITLL